MSRSVLDLTNAYDDDTTRHESPFDVGPRLIDNVDGRSTPRALGWRSSGTRTPLQLTGSSNYDDGLLRSGSRSPLALPYATSRSPLSPSSPPPSYSQDRPSNIPRNFPVDAKTPYELLGVSEFATAAEIKRAYKMMALAYHPDRCTEAEVSQEEATRRFQLISEAFAILGEPKRRAEYDSVRKARRRAETPSSFARKATAPTPSTFKTTFMPESGATSNSWSSRDPLFTGDDRIDLTDLNPFHLFDRMFPHMADTFSRTRDEAGRAEDSLSSFEKPTSEDRPLSNFGKGVEKGNSRKLEESYTRARIDRNGRAHVSTGQRSMKVHKNGGFTFESRTFSASSNTGGMDMMQAMLSQMNMGAGTFGGESGFSAGLSSAGGMFAPSPLAYTSGTPPAILPRGRRSSFGSPEDPYYPFSLMPATSRSLSRRSSRSFDASEDFGSSAMGFGSDNRLVPRRDEDSALGRFNGW